MTKEILWKQIYAIQDALNKAQLQSKAFPRAADRAIWDSMVAINRAQLNLLKDLMELVPEKENV